MELETFFGSVLVCVAALVLDRWLGEPVRWHPLVGFGRWAAGVERYLNPSAGPVPSPGHRILRGLVAVCLVVAPVLLVAGWLVSALPQPLLWLAEVAGLWLALSLRGLAEHGQAVAQALHAGDLARARQQVGRIVSRNAQALDDRGVAAAATESMLENGADAVFASLFWYLVAGLPGVLLHRMINTLDAMWGYRNDRFLYFGRVAARLDDAMNWLPARLTALTYAALGHSRLALHCWRRQAAAWDSPNAGPVMASGAGALGVTLGGPAPYAGGLKPRPLLGSGPAATAATVEAAIRLIQRGAGLWLAVLLVLATGARWLATGAPQ